jgi:antitoxin (DNA-binding transcriptional repressor) of toxin-antitoxin stability system
MRVSVTESKEQLTEFVRRVEAGEEVILTRLGPCRRAAHAAPDGAEQELSTCAARGCTEARRRKGGARVERGAQPGFPLRR